MTNQFAWQSRNAAAAKEEGRVPASTVAGIYRVTTDAVREVLDRCEWHHMGYAAAETDFFDLASITPEQVERMSEVSRAARAAKRRAKAARSFRADVYWLAFEPDPFAPASRTVAVEHGYEDVAVTTSGSMATITLPDGSSVRKKLSGGNIVVQEITPEVVGSRTTRPATVRFTRLDGSRSSDRPRYAGPADVVGSPGSPLVIVVLPSGGRVVKRQEDDSLRMYAATFDPADLPALPELAGSPKQVAWATSIREELLFAVAADCGVPAAAALAAHADAAWWIDNRYTPPGRLVEANTPPMGAAPGDPRLEPAAAAS